MASIHTLNIGQVSLDGWSLPAWTYNDPEFAKVEIDRIFRPGWQVVCHVSDVPSSGDWHSLDYVGESVGMPSVVVDLERRVDEVGRTAQWTGRHR